MKKTSQLDNLRAGLAQSFSDNKTSLTLPPATQSKVKPLGSGPQYVQKLVALFPQDLEQIHKQILFLMDNGREPATRNQVIRNALRAVVLDDRYLAIDAEARAADKRRK